MITSLLLAFSLISAPQLTSVESVRGFSQLHPVQYTSSDPRHLTNYSKVMAVVYANLYITNNYLYHFGITNLGWTNINIELINSTNCVIYNTNSIYHYGTNDLYQDRITVRIDAKDPYHIPVSVFDRLLFQPNDFEYHSYPIDWYFTNFNSLQYLDWQYYITTTNIPTPVRVSDEYNSFAYVGHIYHDKMDIYSYVDYNSDNPVVILNTNSLIHGMYGETAISTTYVNHNVEVPVTLLTKRHGYARGHDSGAYGFNTNRAGSQVWYCDTNGNTVVATITNWWCDLNGPPGSVSRDFSICIFDHDITTCEPMLVIEPSDVTKYYGPRTGPLNPNNTLAPQGYVTYQTEQYGYVGTEVSPFDNLNTTIGGDSGSPDMISVPVGEGRFGLAMYHGRTTEGADKGGHMQSILDKLTVQQGLDTNDYQLNWYYNITNFPAVH